MKISEMLWHARRELSITRDDIPIARAVTDLFGEDQPCMIPEPKLLPGILKIEIPEEAAGLWDLDDACAFAVMILKLRDKAES